MSEKEGVRGRHGVGVWLEHLEGRGAIPQAGKGLVVCGFGGKFRN